MAETAIYLDLTHLRQRLLVFENGMHYSSLILAKNFNAKIQILSPQVIIPGSSL